MKTAVLLIVITSLGYCSPTKPDPTDPPVICKAESPFCPQN